MEMAGAIPAGARRLLAGQDLGRRLALRQGLLLVAGPLVVGLHRACRVFPPSP